MKNVRLFSRNWQGGFIGALLAVLLAAAALLGIFYSAIKNAPEYVSAVISVVSVTSQSE
jgi:hypothetical protein